MLLFFCYFNASKRIVQAGEYGTLKIPYVQMQTALMYTRSSQQVPTLAIESE